MNNIQSFIHEGFEKFIVKNNLDFSLVRNPNRTELNNYVDKETALIFEVFTHGYRSAIEYQITKRQEQVSRK